MKLSLGAIVGRVGPSSVCVWVCVDSAGPVRLRVFSDAGHQNEVGPGADGVAQGQQGHTVTLTAPGLAPDTRYFYSVEDGGGNRLLSGQRSIYTFRTAPRDTSTESFSFGLASCNKPWVGDPETRLDMWTRMKTVFDREEVQFQILCGDQLYADRTYNRLRKKALPAHEEVLKGYRAEYHNQWGKPEILAQLARCPTYMIWDDHEIRNGWGAHRRDATAKKRQAIFKGARQVYSEYQHSHNPQTFGANRFYYAFRYGTVGFVVLDLRGERNSARQSSPLLSDRQWQDIKGWIGSELSSLSALCVVSSVPVAHTPSFIADLIPKSDLKDQWSFSQNRPERKALVNVLFAAANQQNIPCVLLSGDVHVGSFARLFTTRPAYQTRPEIYQFTSSPISNTPNKLISKLQMAIDRTRKIDRGIKGKILDVWGKRNFGIVDVMVDPATDETKFRFRLYQQGRSQPQIRGPF